MLPAHRPDDLVILTAGRDKDGKQINTGFLLLNLTWVFFVYHQLHVRTFHTHQHTSPPDAQACQTLTTWIRTWIWSFLRLPMSTTTRGQMITKLGRARGQGRCGVRRRWLVRVHSRRRPAFLAATFFVLNSILHFFARVTHID